MIISYLVKRRGEENNAMRKMALGGIIFGIVFSIPELMLGSGGYLTILSYIIFGFFSLIFIRHIDYKYHKDKDDLLGDYFFITWLAYNATICAFFIMRINPFSWSLIIPIVVFGEVFFFFDKKIPMDKNKFAFTFKRKLENILESGAIILILLGMVHINCLQGIKEIIESSHSFFTHTTTLTILKYINIGVIAIVVVFIWVWLNSLRYKK